MYIIIKALTNTKSEAELKGILINHCSIREETWAIRRRKDGFVADISNSQNWEESKTNVIVFLKRYKEFIEFLTKNSFEIRIDIEIDNDDILSQNYTLTLSHDSVFLNILSNFNISYDISLYLGKNL